MKKIMKNLVAAIMMIALALVPSLAFASGGNVNRCACLNNSTCPQDCQVCQYCHGNNCPSFCNQSGGQGELLKRVNKILNTVYFWSGIIATIVIIIAGIYYMTSRGNPQAIEKAKSALLYSVIGLIIVLSAAAITNFVIGVLK